MAATGSFETWVYRQVLPMDCCPSPGLVGEKQDSVESEVNPGGTSSSHRVSENSSPGLVILNLVHVPLLASSS